MPAAVTSVLPPVEVWLPAPGYAGVYEVSNLGAVRRALAAPARSLGVPGRMLKPSFTEGYAHVSLSLRGTVRTHRLHVLVLTAFCGPPPFAGAQACHNDGVQANCALTNLRWGTALENQADVDRHGHRCRGSDVHGAVLTERDIPSIRRRIDRGERNPAIARDYGVSPSTIHLIRHNRIWRHVA